MRQDSGRVPRRQLRHREDGEGYDEVEQVEGGQTDQQLVEVAPHLGARQDQDREDVAWKEKRVSCSVGLTVKLLSKKYIRRPW